MCLFLKEHYYDPQSGQGYFTWRIKNIQRNSASSENCRRSSQSFSGGPTSEREAASSTDVILPEEQCREAVSLMRHTSEVDTIKIKMKETFQYRRKMIQVPSRSTDVLTDFTRFLDVQGLVRKYVYLVIREFLERVTLPQNENVVINHFTPMSFQTRKSLPLMADGVLLTMSFILFWTLMLLFTRQSMGQSQGSRFSSKIS